LTWCIIKRRISYKIRQTRRRILKALRMARADAGLTISGLAKRAGVSRDTISNAERGQHSLQATTLHKVAQALGRAPSELLAEEERLAPKAPSSSLEPTFNDVLDDERREDAYDVALTAARHQAQQDRQAAARALESERPQTYFMRHENEAVLRLLEYSPDALAGALVEMARYCAQLEEYQANTEPVHEAQDYSTCLEELGFSGEQIAAYLAQAEQDQEFITQELENISAKDFLEALIASPAQRRIRDYYRNSEAEAETPARSEPA
jgi:transcriptional regulator with XRE-family HTH domain